jgi:hypothetical protein
MQLLMTVRCAILKRYYSIKEQLPVQVKLIKKITTPSILLAVIALPVHSILGSSLVGEVLLLTGCISLENLYHRINWQIIFFACRYDSARYRDE